MFLWDALFKMYAMDTKLACASDKMMIKLR